MKILRSETEEVKKPPGPYTRNLLKKKLPERIILLVQTGSKQFHYFTN